MFSTRRWISAATSLLLAAGLTACGDNGTGIESQGSVSLSTIGTAGGSGSASISASRSVSPGLSVSQTDGQGNSLEIDSVQVVLREVELERQNDECDDTETDASDDNDACEEFSAGIRLFRIPLDGSVDKTVTISGVPADVYDELEFEIHKPDDETAAGQAFINDNPTFADVSVRAKGTFNGQSFIFVSDLNEDQEIEFATPLEVGGSGAQTVNVTLRLAVGTWFVDAGGTLVDPSTANKGGANENLVRDNIRNSIEAFEDDDEDGEPDS